VRNILVGSFKPKKEFINIPIGGLTYMGESIWT